MDSRTSPVSEPLTPVGPPSSARPAPPRAAPAALAPPVVDHIRSSPPPITDLRTAATALLGTVASAAKGEAVNSALPQRYRIKSVEPDPARGKTTNAMIVDTTTGRIKDGKPVGTWIVRSDAPHRGAPVHHLNVHQDLVGGTDPHTPISPGAYKALGVAARVVEGAEKVALPVGVSIDAARLGSAFAADGGHVGAQTLETAAGVAGGWAGAAAGSVAGAQGGAAVGGAVGACFGVVGAVPGAAVGSVAGGIAGGILGAVGGSIAGEHLATWKR
jgi:hypothetical protein